MRLLPTETGRDCCQSPLASIFQHSSCVMLVSNDLQKFAAARHLMGFIQVGPEGFGGEGGLQGMLCPSTQAGQCRGMQAKHILFLVQEPEPERPCGWGHEILPLGC